MKQQIKYVHHEADNSICLGRLKQITGDRDMSLLPFFIATDSMIVHKDKTEENAKSEKIHTGKLVKKDRRKQDCTSQARSLE